MTKIDFTAEEKKIWINNPYCIHCENLIKISEINERNIKIHDSNNLSHKECPKD